MLVSAVLTFAFWWTVLLKMIEKENILLFYPRVLLWNLEVR